ncbi:MAG: FG-GAP repeat domain-containing protein [Vicinamibacterales bacterium]
MRLSRLSRSSRVSTPARLSTRSSVRGRRRAVAAAGVALTLSLVSASARAATLPAGAEIRIGGAVDAAAFARVVASRYHVAFRRVVATDIDRDGDLDVVVAGDRGLEVWVNDGRGRFTSQSPRHGRSVDDDAPTHAWHERPARPIETIQNRAPFPQVSNDRAHLPPAAPAPCTTAADTALRAGAPDGCRIPRAPPLPAR